MYLITSYPPNCKLRYSGVDVSLLSFAQPVLFIYFFFQTKSGLKVASKRGKMEESIMLSWEMEDDLGLGSSKVETLDSFNWFLWAPTNFVLEILAIHRTVSINIQNRADLCHQVMKNYSQD